jgi:hypothetical protein
MANIEGVNPPVLNDTDYVDKIENSINSIDAHDHTSTKGVQIPTGGIVDLAVTTGKIAAGAVTAAKLAAGAADSAALGISGSVVGTTDTQTLTNKSLQDSTTFIVDNSDATKKVQLQVSGVTTGTTRTLTVPDADLTLVGVATSQTLTNKTLTSPTLTTPVVDVISATDQGSTPATPSAGTTKVYSKTDGKVYKLTSAGVEQELGAGAGGGTINYISANPDAETATTGWATYKDASAATPADGTGGSATLTFTRTTSSPLRSTGSFLITTTAADLRGEGASYDFTLSAADQAKVLSIAFDYNIASGTYATGDMTVYIYDVTNSTLIQPAGYQIQAVGSTLANKHIATFQTSATGTSYRLIFHRAVTTSSAMTMKIDNVVVGPQIVQYGAPITDWVSYTPTGTWTGSVTYTGRWRRVGDSMEGEVNIALSGAPTGGTLTDINLPSGYTIDTTKMAASGANLRAIGTAHVQAAATTYTALTYYRSTTSVRPNVLNAAGTSLVEASITATVPNTFASGDFVWVRFMVPVVGWSSTVQMSNDTDTRVVALSVQKAAENAASGSEEDLDTWSTPIVDTHGAFNATTGVYTVQVPGVYEISGSAVIATNATGSRYISARKNSTNISICQNSTALSGTVDTQLVLTPVQCSCVAGDTLRLRSFQNSGSSLAWGTGANTVLTIKRLSGPSAIAASETISVIATTSVTSVNNALSPRVKIVYSAANTDTHGAYNSSTGVFTVPVAGKYRVSAAAALTATALTTAQEFEIRLQINSTDDVQLARLYGNGNSHVQCVNGSFTTKRVAGDTIAISAYQDTGGAIALDGDALKNYLCIEKIGN